MRAESLLSLAFSCAIVACSSKGTSPAETSRDAGGPSGDASQLDAEQDGPGGDAPASWNISVTPPDDETAASTRSACGYSAGALPLATQGASQPDGTKIPIDTIVVVMMENRSFDHYFQGLPAAGQTTADVAPAGASNPGIDGGTVPFAHGTQLCFADTNHSWAGVHQQIDDGKMDGFAISNDATHESPSIGPPGFLSGARAMTYYEASDLPFMYWAAKNFAIGDRYFASVPGPTWPNRMYLYAASSFGLTTNTFPPSTATTLVDYLTTRGVPWSIYTDGTPGMTIFIDDLAKYEKNIHNMDTFRSDAAAGRLPHMLFVDPGTIDESYDGLDEHPPAVMQVGENWLAGVVSTLLASPQWPHLAMFIDFDEHGGIYDHVPPPKACPPDSNEPEGDAGALGGFDEYGVRVPFVVLSPYAKKNYVSHQVYDHTSVVRFIESRFVLPALTNRDANALAPWDMFDFGAPPNLSPPAVPSVPVDQGTIQACATLFAGIPVGYSQ